MSSAHSALSRLRLGESVSMAFHAIRAHKLRSSLTLTGIVIGVAAVIGMMSITTGLQREMERQMTILQSSVFQVQKWPAVADFGPGGHRRRGERPNILAEYAPVIRERCPSATLVGAEVWQFGVAVGHGEKMSDPKFTLAGGEPEFFPNNGYFLGDGRAITTMDNDHRAMVAVIGADIVEDLFPFEDPIGKEVRVVFRPMNFGPMGPEEDDSFVFSNRFTVIGVMEERGQMMGRSEDDRIVIPLTTFESLYGTGRSVNITVQARTQELFDQCQDEVITVMRQLRGLKPQDEDNFALFSSQMGIDTFNKMTGSIKIAAVGICAISLLVAGIGIMNMMLVSVSERTREIGVRKAVGARSHDILAQFVVEAVVLSEVGGVLGVATGLGIAAVLAATVPALKAAVPIWAVLLGLGFCSLVGMVFGIYPAIRASRLTPIVALRYEQ